MATPMGFEPTISTVTGWHVNRYTTGPRSTSDGFPRSSTFILSGRRKAVNDALLALSEVGWV